MPKKKKKKPTLSAKVQKAQKLNDFKKRLYAFAQVCGAEEAYKLIPKREIDHLFETRFKPFDIVPADGQKFSPANYKILKQLVNAFLKNETISFIENGSEVNLYEYYYVGDSMRALIHDFKNEKFKGVEEIIQAFKRMSDKHDAKDGPHMQLFEISNTLAYLLSRLDKGFWLFHYHMIARLNPMPDFRTCYKVEFVPPEKMLLTENGNKRPVYRVGYTSVGQKVSWAQVTPEQLNIDSPFPNLKIDVYIQNHALNRLKERLDVMNENLRQQLLYLNTDECKIVTNSNGQSLINFTTGQHKLGYLVYEYIQGAVVIKTFLLLTSNDTPEGEKLNQLLKLEKHDRQYLDLDKLSHFVKSDIPENKELYKLFTDAGCESLFNVDEQLLMQGIKNNEHAALIEEYISSYGEEAIPVE